MKLVFSIMLVIIAACVGIIMVQHNTSMKLHMLTSSTSFSKSITIPIESVTAPTITESVTAPIVIVEVPTVTAPVVVLGSQLSSAKAEPKKTVVVAKIKAPKCDAECAAYAKAFENAKLANQLLGEHRYYEGPGTA